MVSARYTGEWRGEVAGIGRLKKTQWSEEPSVITLVFHFLKMLNGLLAQQWAHLT